MRFDELDDEVDKDEERITTAIGMLFASTTGTSVLMCTDPIPPVQPTGGRVVLPDGGRSYVGDVRGGGANLSETALKARLEHAFGKVKSITAEHGRYDATGGESALRVTFEEHYVAEAAADSEILNAELVYNERPYEARGQCVVEKGIALTAVAHMRTAEKFGQPAARYLHAQSTRPKLIEREMARF